jgi:hypothetical protein
VPERHAPRLDLSHDTATNQLVRPLVESRDRDHQLGIERQPNDAGRHDRGARLVGQPGGPEQHGVPHALGEREILPIEQFQT